MTSSLMGIFLGTFKEKEPSGPVMAPIDVPDALTITPANGSPDDASLIIPLII